jgi:mono/diheme cytochrome c family protein
MRTALAGIVLAAMCACSRHPSQAVAKAPSAVPSAIVEVGGGKQVSTIGTPLDQPVVIQVNDAQGAAVTGAFVSLRSAAGVTFQPAAGVTGSDGQFTAIVTLGSMAGRYQIVGATTGAGGKPIEIRIDEIALGFEQNQGRVLSDVYCGRCHDSESTAERVSNYDNLVAKPHAFSDGAFLNKMTNADLLAIVSHGGPALGRSAEMPPYARTLNRAGIDSVVAYIRAVADPPYRPRETVYAQK